MCCRRRWLDVIVCVECGVRTDASLVYKNHGIEKMRERARRYLCACVCVLVPENGCVRVCMQWQCTHNYCRDAHAHNWMRSGGAIFTTAHTPYLIDWAGTVYSQFMRFLSIGFEQKVPVLDRSINAFVCVCLIYWMRLSLTVPICAVCAT